MDRDARHARQVLLPEIGEAGQARLAAGRVAIVGCGATGSHLAELLGRAGVGFLRLVDRDIVEPSNLQRQALYADADARAVRPKAEAAAEALSKIDPGLALEPVVMDVAPDNLSDLLQDVHLVLDGTDNFATRFALNDWCVRAGTPFIYTGAIGTTGHALVVVPDSPCLRCWVPDPPQPGALPTCDTAGVLGPAVRLITSLAATEALKLLLGRDDVLSGTLLVADAWKASVRQLELPREPECPCCVQRRFVFLDAAPAATATRLCGRDAVQLPSPASGDVDLAALAERLAPRGDVVVSPFLLRLDLPEQRVLVFRDGRVIVGGTTDAARARSLRDQLLGS